MTPQPRLAEPPRSTGLVPSVWFRAARRGPRPGSRRRAWVVAVPVVAVAAGFLFSTTAITADGTDLRSDRRTNVTQLIEQQQSEITTAQAEVARLQHALAAGAVADPRARGVRERTASLAGPAGTEAVSGPSLTVSLDDAPRPVSQPLDGQPVGGQSDAGQSPASPKPDDLVVHQQDVQAVVNALWAGGAEAMTIQGQRVISTTAVRCVGNTLLLHGRVYAPPFVVTAVGDQAGMGTALDAAPDVQIYRQYVAAYGLKYHVTRAAATALPAYTGPLDLSYARAGS